MLAKLNGRTELRTRGTVNETWMPRGAFTTHLLEAGLGEKVQFRGGQYLYSQGEIDSRFYVLVSGKVYVSNLSPNGHESTFNIMGPGSVIGEAAALTGLPRYSAARMLEASELLQFRAEMLEIYIQKSPRFGAALLQALSLKQRHAVARLHQVVFESPEQRILLLLEQMAEAHSIQSSPSSMELHVNLTHEQIGSLTNLSRVTVTRTLQKLKLEGRIKMLARTIILPCKQRTWPPQ